MSTKQSKEVAINSLFEQDAGKGTENIGADELSIPYLSAVQKTSQAVDPTAAGYIEGAKLGNFILTGSNKVYSKLRVIPVHYKRQYSKYEDNNFRGYVDADVVDSAVNAGTITSNQGRKLFDDEGYEYKDTRTHLLLILNDDGTTTPAILNLSSTQIKKSKQMLTVIQTFLETGGDGNKFTPPSYAHVFTLETVPEKNDNGSWYGVKLSREGYIQDKDAYEKAKSIHDSTI